MFIKEIIKIKPGLQYDSGTSTFVSVSDTEIEPCFNYSITSVVVLPVKLLDITNNI